MVRREELRYIANELEQVSESLAELTDAIDVYQKKDETHRNIYEQVLQLRSESFALFDQIATLAEKEEEVKEPNDTAKKLRESLEYAGGILEKTLRHDGYVTSSYVQMTIKSTLGDLLLDDWTGYYGLINKEES